ncbi:MAG: hypothetical protein LBG17_09685 [Bacteroidales bacterium]|jgi:uncharacterized protein|nr:hypothetical protein [Bacteroidales bacterium]
MIKKCACITTDNINHAITRLNLLTFEVTDKCNLKCKYCAYGEFYEDYDKRKGQFLPVDYAKKIIDYLTKFWTGKYNLSN